MTMRSERNRANKAPITIVMDTINMNVKWRTHKINRRDEVDCLADSSLRLASDHAFLLLLLLLLLAFLWPLTSSCRIEPCLECLNGVLVPEILER